MEFRQIFNVIAVFATSLLAGSAYAWSSEYLITMTKTSEQQYCNKVALKEDQIKCSTNGAAYLYSKTMVESIQYEGKTVFPYESPIKLTVDDLATRDCITLLKAIKGPLLLEKTEDIYLIVGKMYEKGICTDKNFDLAKQYYQKAGTLGRAAFEEYILKNR